MRRGVLWCLVALGASVGPALWARSAEEGSLSWRLFGADPSALAFAETELDFGTVFPGEPVQVEFPFTNASAQPIRIREVVSTCGCVQAEPSQRRFEPGESGVIRTRVYTDGRFGPQTLRLRISTDEGAHNGVLLMLRGHVRVVLRPEPYRLVLRDLAADRERTDEIRVRAREEVDDPRIETRGAGLGATLERVGEREWIVRLTLRPSGTTFGGVAFSVRHVESGQRAEIWIPVVWSVAR